MCSGRESFSVVLLILFQVFIIYLQNSPEATDFCFILLCKSSVRLPKLRVFKLLNNEYFISNLMCSGRESNPHPVRDTILSRACKPIPPPEHFSNNGGVGRNRTGAWRFCKPQRFHFATTPYIKYKAIRIVYKVYNSFIFIKQL